MSSKRDLVALAVYLLLRRGDDVLLLRRSGTGWMDGRYSLVAGHVDAGESATAAMVREAREEVGVSVIEGDLRFAHVMHRNDATPYVDIYFEATRWRGEPRVVEPDKADDASWFPLHALPPNVVPVVEQALNAIVGRSAFSEHAW